jgi:transposase
LPIGSRDYRKTLFVACHAGKFREISTPQNAILLPLGKSKLLSTWSVVGTPQPEVPTPGKNQKRVLYGGLNLKTGHLTGHWASSKSGGHFVEFLEALLADYPDQNILMIADNGSFHHTRQVEKFLEEHRDRLEVRWLPPYCPDLNDIERTWRRLKASHASNFLFNSLDELIANVQKGIREMNATATAH